MRKLLAVLVAISPLSSLAQSQSQNKKTTEIIFDGDVIDGDISKPDVEFVRDARGAKFDKLIRVREDFKEKVMASAAEL